MDDEKARLMGALFVAFGRQHGVSAPLTFANCHFIIKMYMAFV